MLFFQKGLNTKSALKKIDTQFKTKTVISESLTKSESLCKDWERDKGVEREKKIP